LKAAPSGRVSFLRLATLANFNGAAAGITTASFLQAAKVSSVSNSSIDVFISPGLCVLFFCFNTIGKDNANFYK